MMHGVSIQMLMSASMSLSQQRILVCYALYILIAAVSQQYETCCYPELQCVICSVSKLRSSCVIGVKVVPAHECCTDVGWEGVLRNLTSTQPELGSDVTSLSIQADTSLPDIAHISITDLHDTRWQVPESLFTSVGKHVRMLQSNLLLSSQEERITYRVLITCWVCCKSQFLCLHVNITLQVSNCTACQLLASYCSIHCSEL